MTRHSNLQRVRWILWVTMFTLGGYFFGNPPFVRIIFGGCDRHHPDLGVADAD
jgi:hypothetical protein